MTAETILPTTTQSTDEKRGIALLKAIGLDRVSPEQRELALAIADRYDLDPMLKHLVMIEGKPFITRDGLLWVAHRSGQLDGIEVTEPVKVDRYWRAVCTVWRKDMSHPITYRGRFPVGAKNDEEMAVKVAESMALRRAFNVAAPTVDERWASDDAEMPAPEAPQGAKPSLADLARAKAAAVTGEEPAQDAPQAEEAAFRPDDTTPEPDAAPDPDPGPVACDSRSPYDGNAPCIREGGHKGNHRSSESESW